MKKVLILAYDFPPYVSVGGLRPYNWYLYLRECGVEPIVITRQWANDYGNNLDYVAPGKSNETIVESSDKGTILRTPYIPNFANRLLLKHGEKKYAFLRRLVSAFYEFTEFMFPMGPKIQLFLEAKKYLKTNKVDAIIATGNPFVLFKYAHKLSKLYSIPWIADYRDPWTQDPKRSKNIILKTWDSFLEKKYVSHADSVITVSDFFKRQISTGLKGQKFHIISNGFDPEVLNVVKEIKQNDKELSIGFAGTIVEWSPIESFLRVINQYIIEHPDKPIRINFYGINTELKVRQLIDNKFTHLKKILTIYPKLNNDELVRLLATNNLLLLFNYYSFTGTKIYDYLALKRKILLCYTNDKEAMELKSKFYYIDNGEDMNGNVQADLINSTRSGIIVEDAMHLSKIIDENYAEFILNKHIKCNSINVENYSRKVQVQLLSDVIKNIG